MKYAMWMVSLLFVVGCDDLDFLDGYDRNALFASPTQDEIEKVRQGWRSRVLEPSNIEVTSEPTGGSSQLKIVSYQVGGLTQYGALLIPNEGENLPVRMYISGFGVDVLQYISPGICRSHKYTLRPRIGSSHFLREMSCST